MADITITPTNFGTSSQVAGTVPDTFLPGAFLIQKASDGSINMAPIVQVCAGATDAVLFNNAFNVAVFTSTGPDAATLATPGASDVGKVLILINTNTTQNVVATAANKLLNGGASTFINLTAPAHAGAVTILIASNGFWNVSELGAGTWVLS